ncbi:MAG: carboxylating nicotinate-nucleotide diphosphorylase [Parachlamydiales bacterium]|jgi:nicotinate-nucleotide pyrophosphorylase (carboxylating)
MQSDLYFDQLLSIAVAEDLGDGGDITTNTSIPPDLMVSGTFHIKQKGIIAGLALLGPLFRKIDPRISIKLLVEEGSFQKAGAAIAEISGPARGILTGERSALNILQHLSGIATATSEYVKIVSGHACAILDTRKTLPGLRAAEKYAVRLGGGHNHRFGLDDRFIIKSNHLVFTGLAPELAIRQIVAAAKRSYPHLPLEIEVHRHELFDAALEAPVDAIIIFGMTPAETTECVQKAHRKGKKVYFDASVDLTPDAVLAYAKAGIDGICLGAITSSTHALDIGLRMHPIKLDEPKQIVEPIAQPSKKGLMSKLFSKR